MLESDKAAVERLATWDFQYWVASWLMSGAHLPRCVPQGVTEPAHGSHRPPHLLQSTTW